MSTPCAMRTGAGAKNCGRNNTNPAANATAARGSVAGPPDRDGGEDRADRERDQPDAEHRDRHRVVAGGLGDREQVGALGGGRVQAEVLRAVVGQRQPRADRHDDHGREADHVPQGEQREPARGRSRAWRTRARPPRRRTPWPRAHRPRWSRRSTAGARGRAGTARRRRQRERASLDTGSPRFLAGRRERSARAGRRSRRGPRAGRTRRSPRARRSRARPRAGTGWRARPRSR